MPAARTDIDRAGIAAQCAIQGVRPTAEATGLPVTTVHSIAKAAGVKLPDKPKRLVAITGNGHRNASERPSVGTSIGTPAHAVISDALSELGARGRFGAAQMAAKGFESLASMPVAEMLQKTQEGANLATIAVRANVPGWERREQITHTQGDAISEADLERLLTAALAKLPELEAEVRRLDATQDTIRTPTV